MFNMSYQSRAETKRVEGPVTLDEVFTTITTDQRLAAQVEEIEQVYRTQGARAAAPLKQELPGFIPAGVFSKREKHSCIEASGLIHHDFDGLNPLEVEALIARLRQWPYTVMAFKSPSGRGVKLVCRLNTPTTSYDGYRNLWNAITPQVERFAGVKVDAKCKDISRLCFLSYDADAYLNMEAPPLLIQDGDGQHLYGFQETADAAKDGNDPYQAAINAASNCAEPRDFTPQAAHAATNVVVLVKDANKRPLTRHLGNCLTVLQQLGIKCRHNEFKGSFEMLFPDGRVGELDEQWPVTEVREEAERRFKFTPDKTTLNDVVVFEGNKNRYQPYRDWLSSLKWDGTPRLDRIGKDYLGVDEDDDLSNAVIKLIVQGLVARTFQPGAEFHYCPIIVGEQGIGKTFFLKKLAGDYYVTAPSLKDHNYAIRLQEQAEGRVIIDQDEFAGADRADWGTLKGVITQTHDYQRQAWARRVANRPRTWVLVGTANHVSLQDKTGNRRFPIAYVRGLDFDTFDAARDQLLAEAVVQYHSNPNTFIELPRDLQEAANERAESHRTASELEEKVDEVLALLGHGPVLEAAVLKRHIKGEGYGFDALGGGIQRYSTQELSALMNARGYVNKSHRLPGGKNAVKCWVKR